MLIAARHDFPVLSSVSFGSPGCSDVVHRAVTISISDRSITASTSRTWAPEVDGICDTALGVLLFLCRCWRLSWHIGYVFAKVSDDVLRRHVEVGKRRRGCLKYRGLVTQPCFAKSAQGG